MKDFILINLAGLALIGGILVGGATQFSWITVIIGVLSLGYLTIFAIANNPRRRRRRRR